MNLFQLCRDNAGINLQGNKNKKDMTRCEMYNRFHLHVEKPVKKLNYQVDVKEQTLKCPKCQGPAAWTEIQMRSSDEAPTAKLQCFGSCIQG